MSKVQVPYKKHVICKSTYLCEIWKIIGDGIISMQDLIAEKGDREVQDENENTMLLGVTRMINVRYK